MSDLFKTEDQNLSPREKMLLQRLQQEYTPTIARDVLVPLLDQTSPVSLRALDWAVVNWSKQHNVVCSSMIPGQMTNIHHTYRCSLAYWRRKLFDPFRRRNRITLCLDGKTYDTTLGQANFALFTYQTGILAYVIGHIDIIEANMNLVSKKQKKERLEAARSGVVRKRKELTVAHNTMCIAYNSPSTVVFD